MLGFIPYQSVSDLEVRAASQDGQAQALSPTTEGYYWVYTNLPPWHCTSWVDVTGEWPFLALILIPHWGVCLPQVPSQAS